MVGEQATEKRTDAGSDTEHRAEGSLVLATFTQRNDVRDQRHRRDHQPPGADALDGAPRDQPADGVGESAQGGREDEQRRAQLEEALAPEQVAELARQRRRDRVRDQVAGHDPGDLAAAAEVTDDRRERRRDNRLVECRQEHPERDRQEEDVDLASTERGGLEVRFGRYLDGHGVPLPGKLLAVDDASYWALVDRRRTLPQHRETTVWQPCGGATIARRGGRRPVVGAGRAAAVPRNQQGGFSTPDDAFATRA